MITDAAVLEQHAPGCRRRAALELKIVNCLLREIKKAGFTVEISEYEEEEGGTPEDLKAALFNLDEARVYLSKADTPKGKCFGWVYLVFGNDGWDLVCDYTTNLEDFLKPVNELAERLSNGYDR